MEPTHIASFFLRNIRTKEPKREHFGEISIRERKSITIMLTRMRGI
jgi:hypothetical protein